MGGKKRPTISQLERRMRLLARKEEARSRRARALKKEEKKPASLLIQVPLETIMKDLKRVRCITPYVVATRYNIKISTAKKLLRELAEKGVIRLVDKNRRVAIYVPAAS